MLAEGIAGRFVSGLKGLWAERLTGLNSVASALVEGEGDEMTRAGKRFHIASSAATGIAPVQALPTTAASWFFYMPTASKTTAFFDRLGEWLVSGTAGAGATVLVAHCKPANIPTTIPAASSAGIVLTNGSGGSANGTNLIVVASQTLQGLPGWAPLAFMNPVGTVLGQTQMENQDIRGKYAVAPGCGLALAVISPTGTTPLFAPYGDYREYEADME